ncbi:hypothetical protein [Burkholderia ubonensis]|uniref:hypothetical protein n=1 Tax=Burkholderia ubonensis TaxID=101571 RepID=UPI000759FD33|nr:hypothetical protein [Burkholderia ubonensis]KWK78968.1 hypothetical protein WM15_02345 [Burkholderia ubonensis]
MSQPLNGWAQRVYDDNAYASEKALMYGKVFEAGDFTDRRTRHNGIVDEVARRKNRNKSKMLACVEHVFDATKRRLCSFSKACCRGPAKNANRDFATLTLTNAYLRRRCLMALVRSQWPKMRGKRFVHDQFASNS